MRRFVIIGQTATASDDFRIDDLPATSGRLDVLLRCLRAALLFSHGVRSDAVVYLVLQGGPRAPRALRVQGAAVKFLRPDERSLAVLAKKVLAGDADARVDGFVEIKSGIALSSGGLPAVVADLGAAARYILEEDGVDVRTIESPALADAAFFVGGHLGFDSKTRAELEATGARPIAVGPVPLHAEDVVTLVSNEIDRRRGAPC